MGNFNRNGKRSGGGFSRNFSDNRSKRFSGRDGSRPTMNKAVCSKCGADCEVPFKPTGDRPVFCSSCFEKQGGGRSNKFSNERHERSRFEDKQMHDAICAKCGKDCQVPFRPIPGKPVFCNDCFGRGENVSKDSGEVIEQIKILNAKIDKLMGMLTQNTLIEKIEKPEIEKEIMIKKVVAENKEKTKIKIAPNKISAKKKK